MKVNNVRNQIYNTPSYNANQRKAGKNSNPSFGGALAINFWDAVARGGFAASFTLQDMTGTNFPRTWQALQRNKEITGENNYKAAAEVTIREFVTGPSMTLIPMAVLAIAKKTGGSAMEVPMENIAPFSDQMKAILEKTDFYRTDLDFVKNYPQQYSQKIKSNFYQRMFALALGEDIGENGKNISDSAKELAKMLEQYDEAPKRGFFKQLLNKDLREKVDPTGTELKGSIIEAKDQIFEKIITKYTDTRKTKDTDYTGLLKTNMNGLLDKENSITSLVKDFSNFGCDVQKVMQKHTVKNGAITDVSVQAESFMEHFKQLRTGSKFLTNLLMVVTTGLFMMNIPKLYTLYKTNPETDAFRNKEGEVIRANK